VPEHRCPGTRVAIEAANPLFLRNRPARSPSPRKKVAGPTLPEPWPFAFVSRLNCYAIASLTVITESAAFRDFSGVCVELATA
jgi:hypothetical protein